jgi:hypothetical protein
LEENETENQNAKIMIDSEESDSRQNANKRSRYEKVSDSKSSEIEDDIRDVLEEDSVSNIKGDTGEHFGILGDIVQEYDLEEKCSTPCNKQQTGVDCKQDGWRDQSSPTKS